MKSRFPDLVCPKCSSNRFKFPKTSSEFVKCDDCGHAVATLDALQSRIVGKAGNGESRTEVALRHAAEVANSHDQLRASVAETDRLIIASNEMLKRHRKENDEAD